MPYCPRCGSDGFLTDLDCGCTVCEDCETYREWVEGVCAQCRKKIDEQVRPAARTKKEVPE